MSEKYNFYQDKKSVYIMVGVLCLVFSILVADIFYQLNQPEDITKTKIDLFEKENKYINYVRLGIYPDANTRPIEENDIYTGIKLKSSDDLYYLMESRTWSTGDYGKTFITKAN